MDYCSQLWQAEMAFIHSYFRLGEGAELGLLPDYFSREPALKNSLEGGGWGLVNLFTVAPPPPKKRNFSMTT